jgi:hypothetical protein
MLARAYRFNYIAIVASCLLAAFSGCQFHRTCSGYALRGQWSLECERIPPKLSCQPDCANPSGEQQVEQAPVEPERLPWRTRLRGCRLASRIFRGGEKEEIVAPPPSKDVKVHDSNKNHQKPEIEKPDLVLE